MRAENVKADVPKNPAGLICGLSLELEGGGRIEVKSDGHWLASRDEPAKWQRPEFDDSAWPKAKVAAPYGAGPWGKIGGGVDAYDAPYAFGILREIRLVYVPEPRELMLKELERDVRYKAFFFDPVNGARRDIDDVIADPAGNRRLDPAPWSHDCVVVLEAKKENAQ